MPGACWPSLSTWNHSDSGADPLSCVLNADPNSIEPLAGALSVRTIAPPALAIVIVTLSFAVVSFVPGLIRVVDERAPGGGFFRNIYIIHFGERMGDGAKAILIAGLEQRDVFR